MSEAYTWSEDGEQFSVTEEAEKQPELYGLSIDAWHQALTGENLDVPCSRYGRNAGAVAPWAIAAIIIYDAYAGEPDDIEAFAEHAMSMCVNDDSEIIHLVMEHRHLLPASLLEDLTVEGTE